VAKKQLAPRHARRLREQTGARTAVAFIEDDGEANVLIDLGYGGLTLDDAELVAGACCGTRFGRWKLISTIVLHVGCGMHALPTH